MTKCRFCEKESFFEMCENCIKKQNPDRTEKIWKKNMKLADDLGEAYYDFLLKEYDQKKIEKDSKENFGFNIFCDGIRLGLDTVMPLLDQSGIKAAEQKIKDMLKIRIDAKNKKGVVDKNKEQEEESNFWEEGGFSETMGPVDIKERMRTFHMKHDEEMNYNCKKCNKKISAHNKDWHNELCDECFDEG